MGDYVPLFKPGEDVTYTAGAAVVGGRLVAISGPRTVQETAGATAAWVGIATTDAAIGGKVTITSGGVQEPIVAAPVTAGDPLMAAAGGRVTPLTGTNYAQQVGVALTSQSTAGQKCLAKFGR